MQAVRWPRSVFRVRVLPAVVDCVNGALKKLDASTSAIAVDGRCARTRVFAFMRHFRA